MANLHYIEQMEPLRISGAALRVKRNSHKKVIARYKQLCDEEESAIKYISLETREVELWAADAYYKANNRSEKYLDEVLYLVLPAECKMYCGVSALLDVLIIFAAYLEDAEFDIDEESEGNVGRITIKDGDILLDCD